MRRADLNIENPDSGGRVLDAVLPFPGTADAALGLVGGKGHSLIRLAAAGLAVPPGVVLTAHFFDPWVARILASPEWRCLPDVAPSRRPELCEALVRQASRLELSEFQVEALAAANAVLAELTSSRLYAVRSSSPQEDLAGASFAGGYETRLGVRPGDLLQAVRDCFASMFAERVLAYKLSRGIGLSSARMAVVIQAQVASEVAGVAFSINPLNNDYDEAVIDANWGQGETVVAGLVTPDHWVLDKCSGAIVEQTIHEKRLSRWLQADGGLIDRRDHRPVDACLSAVQLQQLLELVKRIEAAFALPVDIEWAIAGETLYLLQARPVTAFVPLPQALLTQPGQRRRLYMDLALSSGLTINAPISRAGLSVFQRLSAALATLAFGRSAFQLRAGDGVVLLDGGRMYLDVSNAMWLGGPRLLARKLEIQDSVLARTLESIDASKYRSLRRPEWAGLRLLRLMAAAALRRRRVLANCVFPFLAPERWYRRLTGKHRAFEAELRQEVVAGLALDVYWEQQVRARLQTLFDESLAAVGAGVLAVQAFARLAGPFIRKQPELRDQLDRGFEGNVVVAMTLAMHRLAQLLGQHAPRDAGELAEQLQAGTLPAAFLEEWGRFTHHFGCRGPLEMDVAHPRYADAPVVALRQIAAMVDDPDYAPAAASARQVERRRAAAAEVIRRAGPLRRRLLLRLDRVVELFAGMRDTPKQHLLMILHGLRRRLESEGERLHRQGRIDAVEHVFDFSLEELVAAAEDGSLDLRGLRATHRAYHDRLVAQVVNFPAMIDSRGRIPRPPRGALRPGEFSGVGLSPGRVCGPARTLRSPHDRALRKGEILIAYTTDPGWTPIFAKASAVVLEIGGALQHGAVVARELGLPCVAGIVGISTAIEDGQAIEVDGSQGTVRLLERQPGDSRED